MKFSLNQIQNAASELIVCQENFDGEGVQPSHFTKMLLDHLVTFGGLEDRVRSDEEIWNLGKNAAAKKPPTVIPQKDDIVRVVSGKTLTHGTEGKVFWAGVNKFKGTVATRIGMKDRQGKTLWTNVEDVVIISKLGTEGPVNPFDKNEGEVTTYTVTTGTQQQLIVDPSTATYKKNNEGASHIGTVHCPYCTQEISVWCNFGNRGQGLAYADLTCKHSGGAVAGGGYDVTVLFFSKGVPK